MGDGIRLLDVDLCFPRHRTIFSEAVLAQKYRRVYGSDIVEGTRLLYPPRTQDEEASCLLHRHDHRFWASSGPWCRSHPSHSLSLPLSTSSPGSSRGGYRSTRRARHHGAAAYHARWLSFVPFAAVAYILGSVIIVVMCADKLPEVFTRDLLRGGFSTKGCCWGSCGAVMKYAIRYG